MFDSIFNVGEFLSAHWLDEVFEARLRQLTKDWRARAEHGKTSPLRGLTGVSGAFLTAKAALPRPQDEGYPAAVTDLHRMLLGAVGLDVGPAELVTEQSDTPVTVPLLARSQGPTGEALHVLQAHPVGSIDDLLSDDGRLLDPFRVLVNTERIEFVESVTDALTRLFLTEAAPRYVLVIAGGWVLLTDVERWAEGRYLAFDVDTALSRKDDKATGELAWHAGLWSADVLLPSEDGTSSMGEFTADSIKHAVGVSEDLREGLRVSIELIANEVIARRRERGEPVEGIPELPGELTTQALRFLYRILFLLYAEARPELAILPVGAPEYGAGYGLDRLRELIQVELTGPSRDGHHLHDSLRVLFRLVNDGHGYTEPDGEGLVFEPLRADLFDPGRAPHVDGVNLRNSMLQEVLRLLLLSKPSKRKGSQRGYVSYAQLGINQLGAVYEGLMAYSGFIVSRDLVELAKDGDAVKGCWLVPAEKLDSYDAAHVVLREDRLTGEKRKVIHRKGTFVYRLSGRDRQRSASYYTPEVLTRCVVRHSLAELITEETPAAAILDYRVCEPAMGSGAFLNEAINQLAACYLDRRQSELGETIPPERYAAELAKVKAYLALHRCYGVDLNATAVELAEVSLWLNVMHPGLAAPWFGLHLRRGNSLVGVRRSTYDLTALGQAKQSWLTTVPTDRPLIEGPVPNGEIHHFLLPAAGWGAVARAKQAKELAPEQAALFKEWAKTVTRKPGAAELARLRGLAYRVERLWDLSRRRMEISEREIARRIDVWGAALAGNGSTVTREQVESELFNPEGPYQRLRLAMDAWCALFFWPLSQRGEPPDLTEWLTTLEGLLGVQGKATPDDQGQLHETVTGFNELADLDTLEIGYHAMKPVAGLLTEYSWLGVAREIAKQEGFFHWELDFAQVFARGGFELQLGNPPWVRPIWEDDVTLAEFDPFFVLRDKIPEATFRKRRGGVLSGHRVVDQYLDELASWAGINEHLGSPVQHPMLRGVQSNLYMNFMERTWRSMPEAGVVGLLHPEGHFTDPKAATLRAETYSRLRRYANFVGASDWFDGVDSPTQTFGLHCYGFPKRIAFNMVTNLRSVETLEGSLIHDGTGEIPGTHYPTGQPDLRPHASRVLRISDDVLAEWAMLFDEPKTPSSCARLLRPVTQDHLAALSTIARQTARLANLEYSWSSGWHEKGAKDDGYIEWYTKYPPSWVEVILQGPHFSVATPFAKEPNENCRSKGDYSDWDLQELPERVIPRTNYQRLTDRESYDTGLHDWGGRPYTDYWRVAWRAMTQSGSERSLMAALIPPGAAHIHSVSSLATSSDRKTVIVSGLWASIPIDYLVKVSSKQNVSDELIKLLPTPVDHSGARLLLLRTLRLNCLTRDYAPLWEELYEAGFAADQWTAPFREWPQLSVTGREWTWDTPLRSDFERRAALVEIDALAAIMLGLTADQLVLMYRGQFAVLRKYEYHMWFDNLGQKIAKDHHAQGVKQQPDDFTLLQAYLDGEDCGDLLDRYEDPFHKPDREAEMRAAYDEFTRRLGAAG